MAKRKGRKDQRLEIVPPTAEQMDRAQFVQEDVVDKRPSGGQVIIGKAFRRRPMVDILRGMFSETEYRALKHYRHHADMAECSLVRDSLCLQRGGNGSGPTAAMVHARRVRDDCERAAGTLADILRAIIVEDISLSEWAIRKGGAAENYRERRGRVVCSIEPRRKWLDIAKLEIQIVAQRVEAEIAA